MRQLSGGASHVAMVLSGLTDEVSLPKYNVSCYLRNITNLEQSERIEYWRRIEVCAKLKHACDVDFERELSGNFVHATPCALEVKVP